MSLLDAGGFPAHLAAVVLANSLFPLSCQWWATFSRGVALRQLLPSPPRSLAAVLTGGSVAGAAGGTLQPDSQAPGLEESPGRAGSILGSCVSRSVTASQGPSYHANIMQTNLK
jgi:hypothetical protein